jgi:ketosteroid isomerase-like protein
MMVGSVLLVSTITACFSGRQPGLSRAVTAPAGAAEQVQATEIAFAQAMADRDFGAFISHLSSDAIFFDERSVQRGAAEVAAAWKPLFSTPQAPFSWAPDHVEVLPSGKLALSTGPVFVEGKVVGRFNSVWRLETPHSWRIVFDKGEAICAPTAK